MLLPLLFNFLCRNEGQSDEIAQCVLHRLSVVCIFNWTVVLFAEKIFHYQKSLNSIKRSIKRAKKVIIMSLIETDNIYLFIPNIIGKTIQEKLENCVFWLRFVSGYSRIVLAVVSFYFMPTNYVISSWCYIISVLLDALDGHAARKFNQCKFSNQRKEKVIDNSMLCHIKVVGCGQKLIAIACWLMACHCSDKVRSYVGSINWPMRHNGTPCDP